MDGLVFYTKARALKAKAKAKAGQSQSQGQEFGLKANAKAND